MMSKVTIRGKAKIEQADYDKIVAFAEKSGNNPELKDLDKLLEKIIVFNIEQILGQIAAAEAQEQASVDANVSLFGPDGKPLGGV